MKILKKSISILLIFMIISTSCTSTYSTKKVKINSDQPPKNIWEITFANGYTFRSVSLLGLRGDSLAIVDQDVIKWISIDWINEVIKIKDSKLGDGAAIGFAAGAIVGALSGYHVGSKRNESSVFFGFLGRSANLKAFGTIAGFFIGAISGSILGGVIGAFAGIDKIHNLSKMNLYSKRNYLKVLLKQTE